MKSIDTAACGDLGGGCAPNALGTDRPRWWQRTPVVPLAFAALLCAFVPFAPVRDEPRLVVAFLAAAGTIAVWGLVLSAAFLRSGRSFLVETAAPLKSHYVQGSVQACIYAYWGWYWGAVYSAVPLILAQLVFLYGFDACLSWSRGRTWKLGCGPLPIILSTNVFIWFENDTFFFQFLLVATGALGKEFIRWKRDGRSVHVFNPSSFTLALFSIVLIATGTSDATWVGRIADTFDKPPQIYVLIFVLGLVVQFFFSTTLITFSAVATLCALNWAYKSSTGTYFFVLSNIPAPVFLGLHLLVTDPATSPRSSTGKVLFGVLYGLGTFVCYGLLTAIGAPTVYDKLLPVPFLNLSVRWMERVASHGFLAPIERWAASMQPRRLNLAAMAVWAVFFASLLGSGYVQGQQEGATYQFWKQACIDGKPGAARGLIAVLKGSANDGHSAAWNELGVLHMEGTLVEKDHDAALRYFAKASKMGNLAGSANVAALFLNVENAPAGAVVEGAFAQLEAQCVKGGEAPYYFLIGRAYETGRAQPLDPARALALYREGCRRGSADACAGVERLRGVDTRASAASR